MPQTGAGNLPRSLLSQCRTGRVEVCAAAFMQCERHSFLYDGVRYILFGEPAASIKCLVDGALVVKHQIRVIPPSAELQRRIVMSRKFGVVVMGVNYGRSPLEIDARTFLKTSGHAKTVLVAALGADSAFAGDIGKGVAAAKRGRDGDVNRVIA